MLGDDLRLGSARLDDQRGHLRRHLQLRLQNTVADLLDVEDADHAHRTDAIEHLLGHALDGLDGLLENLEALGELDRREDVDVPAGEPRRQADVLPTTTDGQGKLVFTNDDGGSPQLEAQADLLHLGGLERVGDEDLARFVPPDDVDLLAAELVDDVPNAASPHAHARADGIDLRVDGRDRDLGAEACLAGHDLDLDHSLGNLGHLRLEEAADEVRVRS